MTVTSRARRAHVPINGPAMRTIRELMGIEIEDMAGAAQCQRAFISKLELGHSRACSPGTFIRIVRHLQLHTRYGGPRALMADPYGPLPDELVPPEGDLPTGPLEAVDLPAPRPEHGRHRKTAVKA